MKIVIPVDEKNINSTVCFSYGRTPFFVFYDTETKEATYFDNSAFNAQGGAGIKASQMIIDKGAKVLLTQRCGENAAEVLNGNVEMFKATLPTAKENVYAYLKGELEPLNQIHPGFHNHGGNQ